MRYYGFELGTNVDEIRNNTKIELRHYGYDNVLAAVNNYMYQNIKNDVNFFMGGRFCLLPPDNFNSLR